MPLHLKPKEEREAYRTQQLTTISRLMKDMPKKVEQWRIQQRLLRKQRRAQRKLN